MFATNCRKRICDNRIKEHKPSQKSQTNDVIASKAAKNGAIEEHVSMKEYQESKDQHKLMLERQRLRKKEKRRDIETKAAYSDTNETNFTHQDVMARLEQLQIEEDKEEGRSFSPLRMKYRTSSRCEICIEMHDAMDETASPRDLYWIFYGSKKHNTLVKSDSCKKKVSWKEDISEKVNITSERSLATNGDSIQNSSCSETTAYREAVATHVLAHEDAAKSNLKKEFETTAASGGRVSRFKASRKAKTDL